MLFDWPKLLTLGRQSLGDCRLGRQSLGDCRS